MDSIFYICDRLACEKCESMCTHTSDPSHAKNFYPLDGDLWEYDTAAPITIQTVPELDSKIIEHLAKSDEVVKLMIPRETVYSLIYEEKTQMLHIIVPQIKSEDIG